MSAREMKIAVILGSARHGRRCRPIADWVIDRLRADDDVVVQEVDPQQMPLSFVSQPLPNAAWQRLEARLEKADGFIVVTPEYHHGYTAVLKQVIDAVPDVWQARPVGFVSYGGHSGGLRAVEQLKQVFISLEAVPLGEAMSLARVERYFANGHGFEAGPDEERHLRSLVERLRIRARGLQCMRCDDTGRDALTAS